MFVNKCFANQFTSALQIQNFLKPFEMSKSVFRINSTGQ